MLKHTPIALALLLFACGGEETSNPNNSATNTQSVIAPPLEGNFSNTSVFTIDPTKENTLSTPNGSHFTIPANALVDTDGKLITEEVTVEFDQYHSAIDVLASGIPMQYDTLGESYTFKTAGMFTLEATVKDNPVYIKEGESIAMNLASDKSEQEPFNFYALNESTGDWTFEHSNSPVTRNPNFDAAAYLPQKPEAASDSAFILDVNLDQSNYAELSDFSGIVWEYTGTEDSLDPRLNEKFGKTRFTDIDLTPTNEKAYEYFMTFKSGTNNFTTRVKAALSGGDLDLAMANFTSKKTEIAKKIDSLQKPFIRSVDIQGFGTYNYDYIYHIENPVQLIADFDFGADNDQKDNAMVAVVYEDEAAVVNYPKGNWSRFGLNRDAAPKVIAILPNNKIAVYSENIKNCYDLKEHTFKMTVRDKTIETKADLIDALAGI